MINEYHKESQEIVDFILKGDTSKLNKWATSLVKKIVPDLEKIVRKNFNYPNPRMVAEDLFQDSFVYLIDAVKAGRYKPTKKIEGYFFMICKNQLLKKAGKNIMLSAKETPREDELLAQVRKETLIQLVEKYYPNLKEACQVLLAEKYGQKKTLKKIAAEMNTPYANLRKQSERCITHLRKLIIKDPVYKKLYE